MAKKLQVILDTNIIVSAIVFRGKPRQIYDFALNEKFKAVISPILISELTEILSKKFLLSVAELNLIEHEIKELFKIVHPKESISIARDVDDNHVLEAALAGKCEYVITGDADLLDIKNFRGITIVTPHSFLNDLSE